MSTSTPKVSHIMSSTYEDTERYTNLYHSEYIPGTINLLLDKVHVGEGDIEKTGTGKKTTLKTTGNGIVLHPQPTDSPNDPLNWGKWTKLYQFCLLAFITGFTAATSNDAGSVQDSMNEIYDISYDSMNTGAGVLFASIGLTTLILAPTSSLYGRKISYIVCIIMGLIGAAWFGAAKKTRDTIWSQLFVGSSEACAEATVQLSISDMYFSHQLSSALTVYILATSVGTYLGPLIAGFIVSDNFRWVGYTAVVISAVLLIVIFTTMYETYFDRKKYNYSIEGKKPCEELNETIIPTDKEKIDVTLNATQSNGSTSNSNSEIQNQPLPPRDNGASEKPKTYLQNIAIITPSATLIGLGIKQYFQRLFLMLRVFWFPPVVYSGILWGLQDAFLTFYLTTEDDQYYDPPWSYSDTGVAIMNVPCVIGATLGCMYAGYFSDTFVIWLAKRRGGIQEAEDYLWFLFALIIICPVGLIIFAVGTDHTWSWKITYTVGLGFIGFSFGCAGDIAMAYLMAAYPEMVLEGMVGVACINNGIGCIFTFACSPWLDAMGNTNTYIILSALQVAAVLLNIPFLLYGKQIRIWTKKYYVDYIDLRDGKKLL